MIGQNITVTALTDNKEILESARLTVWKGDLGKEPSSAFMESIYKSEHSPIRNKIFKIKVEAIPYWLSVHFVRHWVGSNPQIQPYIATNRDDRVDIEAHRDELTNMELVLNAQSIIDISKLRLCSMAHIKAQQLWREILEELKKIDIELYNNCVPTCVYRGFCPEQSCCGRVYSKVYQEWREEYTKGYPKIGDKRPIE